MFPFALFVISGAMIATLTVAKRIEEKKKRTPLVLRVVSRSDERIRELHGEALRKYSQTKDKSAFWIKKQLPLKLKSLVNKMQAYAKEKGEEYLGDMRDSRLIKKSDGISEFFKNISEIEKGGGEINETLPEELREEFNIETSVERPVEVTETKVETIITTDVEERPVHMVTEVAPEPVVVKKKRAYKPRVKKLAVLEVAD
jgi:hypothetical protein